MLIVVNARKTLLFTSLGLAFLGSLYAAYQLYYRTQRKKQSGIAGKAPKSTGATPGPSNLKSSRPNSANKSDATVAPKKPSSHRGLGRKEKQLLAGPSLENVNNLPSEELLVLGLNYLSQAIRTWEQALDAIESASYMQSQTLALPNDEHADLVYKLRNLVEAANKLEHGCSIAKQIKSSQTLQIIESRLALKQQLYAEALLNTIHNSVPETPETGVENVDGEMRTSISVSQDDVQSVRSMSRTGSLNSLNRRYFSSDDDNESFASAESEVDWLDDDLFAQIENRNDKNVLYEMGISNVSLGRVTYRVSRAELLHCKSDEDFAAKLFVLRMGFDRLMQDTAKKEWIVAESKTFLADLLVRADKETAGFMKAFDDMLAFMTIDGDWTAIKDELATRDVHVLNFYDIALDFILLDAFEDLEAPPGAITAVISNTWLSQSFKQSALATAVWSVLKAKRRLLKYPNGFISRFYLINEFLVPVLAWGFLGTDEQLKESCQFMKNTIVEYLRCLFDVERTRYTNLEELTTDIETHTNKYLQLLVQNQQADVLLT